jgi:O-Antigen ligase
MLSRLFFILPFFMYGGIFLQAIGFYVFSLLAPLFLFKKSPGYQNIEIFLFRLGACLIGLHILFPFINVWHNLYSSHTLLYNNDNWPQVLKSKFSSSFLFGGILLVYAWFSLKLGVRPCPYVSAHPAKSFFKGLWLSSVVFFIFLLVQHFTGWTPFQVKITSQDLITPHTYRVFGLYGHPLTVASVGLTISVFAWVLFWEFQKNQNTLKQILPFSKKNLNNLCLISIFVLNGASIFLSGSRAPVVIWAFVTLSIYLYYHRTHLVKCAFFALSGCMVVTGGMYAIGILNRVLSLFTHENQILSSPLGENRFIFWKTYFQMFSDNPWMGFGSYWIEHSTRSVYYNTLGYGYLKEKFNAHNNYLESLASIGIIGSACVVLLCTLIWNEAKRTFNTPQEASYLKAFKLCFIANALHCFTQNVFFDSSVTYMYLTLVLVLMWHKAFHTQEVARDSR